MIYKLDQLYLVEAEQSGMRFICMSETGLYFLAQADQLPEGIEAIDEYSEDQESILLTNPEWIQPSGDM